jgi:hypothetical protein
LYPMFIQIEEVIFCVGGNIVNLDDSVFKAGILDDTQVDVSIKLKILHTTAPTNLSLHQIDPSGILKIVC